MAIESQRRHVHTRSIRVDVYARDDELWDEGFAGERKRRKPAGEEVEGDHKPFQLDRCHALVTTGAAVARFYPRWFREAGLPTRETDTEQGETR